MSRLQHKRFDLPPGEVLISGVTRDLLAGSGLAFESRGPHELNGIDGARELFALVG